MTALKGIYPPIPTPFDRQGTVDIHTLTENLEIWAEQPLRGVIMPGSNSELPHLSREEKSQIWRICVDILEPAGKMLIAGTGANTTQEAVTLTKAAADLGAKAALVLPPYFYKPHMTHDILLSHFMDIAEASPLDLLLYHVPQFTGVDLPLDTITTLADHPRIVGIKDSSANLTKMSGVLASHPDFKVFSGSGSALLPFLSVGAAGGIMALANIAPTPLHDIYEAFHAGRIAQAREHQLKLVEINTAVTDMYGVPGLKYAMDQLGLTGGYVRSPLRPLDANAKLEIDTLINKAGVMPLI